MRYIYIGCGLWDELNFPVGTRIRSNKLKAAGIAHEFELFPDGRHRHGLDFIKSRR